MKRLLAALGFAALSATVVLAQQHNAADMDKMQAGGTLPAGWKSTVVGDGPQRHDTER